MPDAAGLAYHNFSIEHRPCDQSKLSDVVDPVRFLADRYAEVASDGVGEEDIVADFGLTGLATERLIADWRAFYPGRELLWPHYGTAPPELMRVFLAELTATFGGTSPATSASQISSSPISASCT